MQSQIIILLVEDDPAHAEIITRIFRKPQMNKQIIHLSDGAEALDYLFRKNQYTDPENSPRPDLILLDLRLPKVDGLEVLKRIKSSENLRRIPIVVLTTSEADVDIATAYDLNVNSYLVKPLDYRHFEKEMEIFDFYWSAWNKYAQTYES